MTVTETAGFLAPPATDDAARALSDADLAEVGYVMNLSRAWAHQPDTMPALFALMRPISAPEA